MPYLNNLNYQMYILKNFFFNLNRTYLNNNSSKVKAFLLEPCYSARKNKKNWNGIITFDFWNTIKQNGILYFKIILLVPKFKNHPRSNFIIIVIWICIYQKTRCNRAIYSPSLLWKTFKLTKALTQRSWEA